ncbi:MAG: RHS repeat-associated core domain-containing protein [Thermodesulfobacteriota bacterium]|nr:RHS repeat-associated core domain-containing protein [Thermodesulfobacteriota bacterium]
MWAQKRITACFHTGTYSSRGELLRVDLPDGTTIEYIHDPLGRRIAKKVNGTITEKYLWQGRTRLLAVYDGSDNLLMRFQYADTRMPVAVEKEGVLYYLAYNQVGSLRAVADSAGNIVKQIEYDSHGYILNDTAPGFDLPFGFAGGLHDRDTGLVRFGYRDYDPDTGRWTAKDPIGFAGGDSDLYGYVLNDPVNFVDPWGLADESITGLPTGEINDLKDRLNEARNVRGEENRMYQDWLDNRSLPLTSRERLEQQIRMNEELISRFQEHLDLLNEELREREADPCK